MMTICAYRQPTCQKPIKVYEIASSKSQVILGCGWMTTPLLPRCCASWMLLTWGKRKSYSLSFATFNWRFFEKGENATRQHQVRIQ